MIRSSLRSGVRALEPHRCTALPRKDRGIILDIAEVVNEDATFVNLHKQSRRNNRSTGKLEYVVS